MPHKGRGRTIYVRITGRPQVERWLRHHCVASAGPYPSIAGVRYSYWGYDCLVVRGGSIAYNMGRDVGQVIPQ